MRPLPNVTRSVTGYIPTRSMGTIIKLTLIVPTLCVVTPLRTLRVR